MKTVRILFNVLSPIVIMVSFCFITLRKFKEPIDHFNESQYLNDCLPWIGVISFCIIVMLLTIKEK